MKRYLLVALVLSFGLIMACSKDDDKAPQPMGNGGSQPSTNANATALVHTSFLYRPEVDASVPGIDKDLSMVFNFVDASTLSVDFVQIDGDNNLLYGVRHYDGRYTFNGVKGTLRFADDSYSFVVDEEGLAFSYEERQLTAIPIAYAVTGYSTDYLPNTFWRIDTNHVASHVFSDDFLKTVKVYLSLFQNGDGNSLVLKSGSLPESLNRLYPSGIVIPIDYDFAATSFFGNTHGAIVLSQFDAASMAVASAVSDIRYVANDQRHIVVHLTLSSELAEAMGLTDSEVYVPMVRSNQMTEEEQAADEPEKDVVVARSSYTISGSQVLSGTLVFTDENIGTFSFRLSFYPNVMSGVFTYTVKGTDVVITPSGTNDRYLQYLLVDGALQAKASSDGFSLTFPAMGSMVTAYRDAE